jgi:hypothetical protein
MPSVSVEGDISAATALFTAPLNKICKITGIEISDTGGVAGIIRFTDTFTTAASNGAAAALVAEVKKDVYVAANDLYQTTKEMAGMKIIGALTVINVTSNDEKAVTVMWE